MIVITSTCDDSQISSHSVLNLVNYSLLLRIYVIARYRIYTGLCELRP